MQLVVDNGPRKRRPGSHPCVGQHTALSSTPSRLNILPFSPMPLTSVVTVTTGQCEAGPGPGSGSGQGCKLVTGGQPPRHGRHGAQPEPRERSWRKFRNIARHRILRLLGTESINCRMTAEFAICQTLDGVLQEVMQCVETAAALGCSAAVWPGYAGSACSHDHRIRAAPYQCRRISQDGKS